MMEKRKVALSQKEVYARERFSAIDALRLANEIAFAPVVFQVSRLMLKFGIFKLLTDCPQGLTLKEIAEKTTLSPYAVQVLLESSLTIGTVLKKEEYFHIAKPGWFLMTDERVRVNMDFIQDVNYLGLFDLERALVNGKPEGLKVFGNWPTIYEGLSALPADVQKSWFAFDHYYSDCSFEEALQIVFRNKPARLLDVGGNTGRWAMKCVSYSPEVEVTVMDLPQQLQIMEKWINGQVGAERIYSYPANLLDHTVLFPEGFDVIWMSQFLDCFSEGQVVSILKRAACAMKATSRLYIMETLWDRHPHEIGSYCLTQISVYFTALANGNSKMFHSGDLCGYIEQAGLKICQVYDGLGKGHCILECKLGDKEVRREENCLIPFEMTDLLPQRPPFIMVDRLVRCDAVVTETEFQVRENNLFYREGVLQEAGIVENIAQTCAARIGYFNKINHAEVKVGFIGALRNLVVRDLPGRDDILNTRIEVVNEVMALTLIQATVKCNGCIVATGEMKIAIGENE